MRLTGLSQEGFGSRVRADLGGDPAQSSAILAELLRAELRALGVTTRTVLADRVARCLVPELDRQAVLRVLQRLEEVDDVVAGPGGRVAAAPVRAVHVAAGRYVLLGTASTQVLAERLRPVAVIPGLLRRAQCGPGLDNEVAAQVVKLNGRVVPVDRWAGFAPAADEAWLDDLCARLLDPARAEADTPLWRNSEWQVYSSTAAVPEQHRRWRRAGSTLPEPVLVRARQIGGYHVFGLVVDRDGRRCVLPLGRDEARRTVFALDARAGASVAFSGRRTGDVIELVAGAALPYAEYRYLLALAERLNWDGYPVRYRVGVADLPVLTDRLLERLHVRIVLSEAAEPCKEDEA